MSRLSEQVAHLRGLMEGLGISSDSKEAKALQCIADILEESAEEIDLLNRRHEELDDYVDSIDSDLSDLEEAFYGDDEDEDEDEDDEDDDGLVEYTCPHCGQVISIDPDELDLDEEWVCPHCNKPLFPEDEEDEEEEDDDLE